MKNKFGLDDSGTIDIEGLDQKPIKKIPIDEGVLTFEEIEKIENGINKEIINKNNIEKEIENNEEIKKESKIKIKKIISISSLFIIITLIAISILIKFEGKKYEYKGKISKKYLYDIQQNEDFIYKYVKQIEIINFMIKKFTLNHNEELLKFKSTIEKYGIENEILNKISEKYEKLTLILMLQIQINIDQIVKQITTNKKYYSKIDQNTLIEIEKKINSDINNSEITNIKNILKIINNFLEYKIQLSIKYGKKIDFGIILNEKINNSNFIDYLEKKEQNLALIIQAFEKSNNLKNERYNLFFLFSIVELYIDNQIILFENILGKSIEIKKIIGTI